MRRDRGVTVIIAYKLIKGGLWLIFGTVLAVSIRMGLSDRIAGLADQLRLHARPWSLELARVAMKASSRRALWTVTVALFADGGLT
ncbi:MAG: hypothetical protein ACREJ3_06160, partial [Polyangiaceae bacterium]